MPERKRHEAVGMNPKTQIHTQDVKRFQEHRRILRNAVRPTRKASLKERPCGLDPSNGGKAIPFRVGLSMDF